MNSKQARQIQIDDYLLLTGIEPLKINNNGNELFYSSPLRKGDSNPSFKVDKEKNLWFDFGLGRGGNIIDLVCQLQNTTVKDALAILEHSGLSTKDFSSRPYHSNQPSFKFQSSNHQSILTKSEKTSAFNVLDVSEINKQSLITFLEERKINFEIAKHYLKQIKFRPNNKNQPYYALAWPCGDGYEARNKLFKGFVGTHKDIITVNLKDNQSVSIFEGYMDFLAFLSYYKLAEFQNTAIILNSINLKKRALETIKKHTFTKAYLFLDNDEGGKETAEFFTLGIENTKIIDKSSLYDNYNDFNEMVVEKAN